jgi:SAM-dependent methyltransferase
MEGGKGGYDDGYQACIPFWGEKPADLVQLVPFLFKQSDFLNALDIGCGEGKNANFLASLGINVKAIDISEAAINNARKLYGSIKNIEFDVIDARKYNYCVQAYDIVVFTGILHCLDNEIDINDIIKDIKSATIIGGVNILSVFNDASNDFSGHQRSFNPCLLPHKFYIGLYESWEILHQSNKILEDTHPNNNISHHHSITRIMARKI